MVYIYGDKYVVCVYIMYLYGYQHHIQYAYILCYIMLYYVLLCTQYISTFYVYIDIYEVYICYTFIWVLTYYAFIWISL